MNRTLLYATTVVMAPVISTMLGFSNLAADPPAAVADQTATPAAPDNAARPPVTDAPAAEKRPSETGSSDAPLSDSQGTDAQDASEYSLKYIFHPGQTLRYETRQSQTMEAMVQENRKIDRSEATQRRIYTVRGIDDRGVAHLTMQFEHVKMQLQSNDNPPVVFDSTMKDDQIPQMFRMASDKLRGSAARFWLGADGRARPSVKDRDSSAVTATLVSASGTAAPEKPLVSDSEREQPKPAAEASDGTTFLTPLPEKPVRVGDTWTDTHKVKVRVTKDINRDIEILRTFRLQSVKDGVAFITFSSSITSSVRSPVIRAQLIQSTPRGSLELDLTKGIMLRKEMRFDETVVHAMGENTVVTAFGTHSDELLAEEGETAAESSEVQPQPEPK